MLFQQTFVQRCKASWTLLYKHVMELLHTILLLSQLTLLKLLQSIRLEYRELDSIDISEISELTSP